jgi:TolA-binding protein
MKKLLFLSLIGLISIGCNSSAPQQVQTNSTTVSTAKKDDTQTVAAHTTENQKPVSSRTDTNSSNNSGSSGASPMSKAVDVSAMTATIEKAEKDYEAKPNDAKAKEILATAYFTRAFALTDAAQYSAALADFRKGLKLNPSDTKAKDMMNQIVSIYESMGRPVPKEGEEKAPMPIS